MRAKEFITETTGKHHAHHAAVHRGIGKSRDPGGYNIPYHQLRTGVALAIADGSPRKLDVDHESWMGAFWTDHPFTEVEHNMLNQVRKIVPTEHEQINPWKDSEEPEDTNKVSPVRKFVNNKYGI